MKIAIIGSRDVSVSSLDEYVSVDDEIVSGGASGVDSCAEEYARLKNLKITVFLPEYEKYGRAAPIVRNKKIVDYADKIVAFWNGASKGTLSVIKYAKKVGKTCVIINCQQKTQIK